MKRRQEIFNRCSQPPHLPVVSQTLSLSAWFLPNPSNMSDLALSHDYWSRFAGVPDRLGDAQLIRSLLAHEEGTDGRGGGEGEEAEEGKQEEEGRKQEEEGTKEDGKQGDGKEGEEEDVWADDPSCLFVPAVSPLSVSYCNFR